MIVKLILTTLLLSWISAIEAYFYVPNFASVLPFTGGMATAQRNSSLIMFGGETPLSTFNNSNMYELTQTSNSFDWRTINQVNAPPGNIYGQAIVSSDQNTMYLLGGMTNATNNREVPFQYYAFNFQNNSWTAAPTNTNATNMPLNRHQFSATYDNANKIYIYGGALNSSAIFSDFFSFDISTKQFTPLASPNVYRFGHTASYLSNGKIVVIGGSAQIVQNQTTLNILVPMSTIHIYDIASNTWEEKTATATGLMPSTRHVHNAVVTSDNKIIVFGGDNNEQIRNKAYLNQVAVLDTNTWQWSLPDIKGIPPSRRSYASGGLVGNNLVVAFGSGYNTYYNDINVLNLNTMSWLQSFDSSTGSGSSGLSGGAIAGISIACVVVLVIILFLLWKFQKYVRWLVQRIHRDIWKPRTGEPLWAETTRIVCQILLLFIFFIFLAFVIRQAINSPNVTQKIVDSVPEVQVPDVRFCFDGFPLYPSTDIRAPGVSCSTDTGYSCTQFVQPLNMSVFQPTFTDNLGAVSCVLFTAPKTFTLTSTSGSNNGSRLLFTMFGDQNAPHARIHVSVYPKAMDPNTVVYGLTPNEPNLMSAENILNWQTGERNDIQVNNIYTVEPFTYSALSYDLIDHKYLNDAHWNYVGFLPISNSTPEVQTNFRSEAPNPNYKSGHIDLGVFAVFPNSFVTTIEREVKMYTLVNALGFVGGIFGLLIALQAWLFGYRPRSPWGVVHRWSVGNLKRSLLRGLHSKFKITESGVPLVHPVHHRFSVTNLNDLSYEDSEAQRINRVEERMQMLEMLFKAYYVDDEVFRSLDDANRVDTARDAQKSHGASRNPNAHLNDSARFSPPPSFRNVVGTPKTEKVPDNDYHPVAKPEQPLVHPFTRQDTDASSASHIPLTHHQRPHAPPYQPSTTVQLSDED